MLQRLNIILNYVIGSFIGVFIAHSIYKYLDYTKNPDLYRAQSAPWYTSIQVNGLVVALIIFIVIVIKLLIKKKMRDI
jgi:cytosine/uracil/thiamine/allantoin permease